MYRAPGWRRHALVRDADRRRGRQARHDDRGPVAQPLPCGAEGLDRGGCAAVRLLPVGPDHGGRRAARQERQSERRRDRRRDDEHLPLRHIPADPRRHPPRRAAGLTMSARTPLTRREFLETSGAASAGLLIGFHLPSGSRFRTAAAAPLAPSKRVLTYGKLVAKAATVPLPHDVPLKDPKDWKILGTRVRRLDTPPKVDGSAQFGIDVKLPGMLVAVIARSPVFGGKVKSFDAAKAKAVPGVRHVVQISSGVAVVADGYWPAKKGRDALDVSWDEGPNAQVSSASIAQLFAQRAEQAGAVARHDGDPSGTLASSASKIDAAYDLPFLAHATMEPMNCTAHVRADGVDIWAPTQFQTGAQGLGAKIGGVAPDKVQVHTTYLGGGFGRRFELDFIQEALETSKAAGAPVKVIWAREDDIRNAHYRPANYHVLHPGLDAARPSAAWQHTILAPAILARVYPDTIKNGLDGEAVEGGVGMPYAVPNVHVDYLLTDTGIPVGFWRSVNNSYNAFAVESFIDELAHAAKKDPYEYRRDLLAQAPRHLGALNLAASKAGWGTPPPAGRARGIAVYKAFESYVAEVAEVSLASDGAVKVHRVVCAVDCGPVVNPSIVEAQMESAIAFGLTAALYGEIAIEGGRVKQSNFHDYPMVRLAEMPQIQVHIVPSTDAQGGVGQPGTPPIAPAVCNAIFAATGKRVRKLPIGKVV